MKALFPCTLAALAVGIATGWMLRGGDGGGAGASPAEAASKGAKTEERTASAGTPASAGESAGAGDKLKSELRAPKEKLKDVLPAADEHLEQIMANMKEQHTKRSEAKIAELTEKLGLNASQQAQLREYFDKRNPATTVTKGEGGRGIKIESKSSDTAGSLDDLMKDLLTADQSSKYEEMKQTEQNRKIEARTLRELASLTQAVELREDQRQAVYEILEKQARTDVDSGAGGFAMAGGLLAGAAPAIEFADIGGAAISAGSVATNVDVMAFQADDGPEGRSIDHGEAMRQLEQRRKAELDAKVNSLSGVLDASQLAKYRQSLEQGPMLFSR